MNLSEIILCGLLLVSAIPTAHFGLALLIGTTETKVTGEKVLYENNLGITLSKVRYGDWMIVSDIHTEYELMSGYDIYHITKGNATIRVPDVTHTEYVETTGYEPEAACSYETNIRVTKATLIEEEHTRVWPFGNKRKIMGSRTTNKMVIEYKITNKDEIERQKVEKQRHTETLRQFVTMKGE